MKWTKFTLKTTTEAVDLISSMLDEIGIEGIEIEDNVPLSDADTKGMFIDILPELPPDDGTAKVSFYVEDLSNLENIIHQVNAGLDEIAEFVNVGERTLSVSETEDKDQQLETVFQTVYCRRHPHQTNLGDDSGGA